MLKADRIKEGLFILLLTAFPFCAYLNSLDGTFVFDDSRIYNSPALQQATFSLSGLIQAVQGMEPHTRPVANLTFVLNYLVHGFATRGYHLVNLCIHIAAGVLLYFFLKTTFAQPALHKQRQGDWIAFAAALIWLVHPLQTQAVSYIVQRMTSLSAFFVILSLLLYARGRTADNPDRRVLLFGGCILTGVLALGSKENAVTLPLFIFLYEWFFVQDLRRDWLASHMNYLAGIVILLVMAALLFLGDTPWRIIADGYATRNFSLGQRVLTESRIILYYLGLLVFPHPARLSSEHDFELSISLFSPATTLPAILAVLAIIALAVVLAPRFRLESFCILWFFGNHVLEGSIVPLELVFEHRNYLPSMMFFPLVAMVSTRFCASRTVLSLLTGGMVILLATWTHQRNSVWQNEFSLWRDAVDKAPRSARAHNNLAIELESMGKENEAVFHYQETIRLDPGYIAAHLNLGRFFTARGDIPLAVAYYQRAVLLNPEDPEIRMSLGNALLNMGNLHAAKTHYLQALRLDPEHSEARKKLEGIRWKLKSTGQGRQEG